MHNLIRRGPAGIEQGGEEYLFSGVPRLTGGVARCVCQLGCQKMSEKVGVKWRICHRALNPAAVGNVVLIL